MITIVVGLTKAQREELERLLRLVPPVDLPPDVGQLISFDVCAVGTLERCFRNDEEE